MKGHSQTNLVVTFVVRLFFGRQKEFLAEYGKLLDATLVPLWLIFPCNAQVVEGNTDRGEERSHENFHWCIKARHHQQKYADNDKDDRHQDGHTDRPLHFGSGVAEEQNCRNRQRDEERLHDARVCYKHV